MHPIEAPNDNFRLLIRQASAQCWCTACTSRFLCGPKSMFRVWLEWPAFTHGCVLAVAHRPPRQGPHPLVLIAEITVHAIAATGGHRLGGGFHYLMPVVPVAMLSSSEHRMTKNAIALCLSAIYLGLDG